MRFLVKILITSLVVASASEISKRFTFMGAIIASLPLTSILALVWLYWDTKDISKVSTLSYGIFWAVLPSLLFFLVFPFLLQRGVSFFISLAVSCSVMAIFYFGFVKVASKLGIQV